VQSPVSRGQEHAYTEAQLATRRAKSSNMNMRLTSAIVRTVVATLLAAGALAPACAAIIPPGTPLAAKQEMVRNNGAEPDSLDPAITTSLNSALIVGDLFEGLTAEDHHGNVVPGVAESWKRTDPTTWVFKLRKTAVWSNGQPVTADDFVYGWRRHMDPKTASISASVAVYILNGQDVVKGRKPLTDLGVRAIDRQTLEVKTAGLVPFLDALVASAQMSPEPRAAIEKFGKDWTKPGNLVSNGAYVLKDWQVNSKIVLEKNPRYWDAANVQLTRVTFLCVEDGNADLKLYQSGEEDYMQQLPPGTYSALKARYPDELRNGPVLGMRFSALNNDDPLLKDVRVRKALSMVIDREVLASKITADGQVPLYGLTIASVTGAKPARYDWADWPMDKRVAEARKLLAEAGVKPGTHLKYAYNTSDYNKKMAIFTASEWKTKLGLETDLDSFEFKVLLGKIHGGDFQVGRFAFGFDVTDVTEPLELVQCESDLNYNRNCDRKADGLITQGTLSTDPAQREALLTQALKLLTDDYPMIPLLQASMPRLVKAWIGGYDQAIFTRSKDFFVLQH